MTEAEKVIAVLEEECLIYKSEGKWYVGLNGDYDISHIINKALEVGEK